MKDAARCAVTTTLSACAGGATTLAIHVALKNPPDVTPALNGREAQRRLSPG
jgi:ammonia channel protein AmtB